MEQRTEQWFEQRRGRFTASRISELMGKTGLNKTGETYVFDMACDIVFGWGGDTFTSFDMQRGIELEPIARDKFAELNPDKIVQEVGFYTFGEDAGASPDGLVDFNSCLEIKCPKPLKLFGLIKDGINGIDSNYIDQMQLQMLCTDTDLCYFFNFGYYNDREIFHTIEVLRDEKRIELMKERIEQAAVIRDEFVQMLMENQQF